MKPAWALRATPDRVLDKWPEAENWRWLSPYRLHATGDRCAYLVVLDPHDDNAVAGQKIPDYRMYDQAYVIETYSQLRQQLALDIAARLACAEGTPIRAEHSSLLCRACGKRWDRHPAPALHIRQDNGAA